MPGESDLVEWVEGVYQEAEKAKNEQANPDDWDHWITTYWGDQWPDNLPTWKAPIVVNEIKALALQELSDLTDSKIVVYAQKDPEFEERDQAVEKSIQGWWTRSFADMAVLNAALDAMIYPCGFLQVGWNPLLQEGQGDVTLVARDPKSYFPDPDATNEDELRYEILRDVLDLVAIWELFPETGKRVTAEANYSTPITAHETRPRPGLSGFKSPLYSGMTGQRVEGYKKARAALLTVLVDDPEIVDEIEELQVPGITSTELKTVTRRKYPHRRLIQVAGQRVLNDIPNPYEGRFVHRVLSQPSVHAFWPGSSFVSEYEWIQKTADKMDSQVAENAIRLNSGILFADANSGIDPRNFQSIPGQVVLKTPGSQAQFQYPPPMPPDMVQAGERFRSFIRQNAGFGSPRRQGGGVPGNVSAEMVDTEISQSMGLTRLRGRLLHEAVQRTVSSIFRFMAIFYTTKRHTPFILDNKFYTAPWVPFSGLEARQRYSVHVDRDSYQVKAKASMQRMALILAKFGMLAPRDVLKILEFPDAEGIAQRAEYNLALQAQAKKKSK